MSKFVKLILLFFLLQLESVFQKRYIFQTVAFVLIMKSVQHRNGTLLHATKKKEKKRKETDQRSYMYKFIAPTNLASFQHPCVRETVQRPNNCLSCINPHSDLR
jgi:hypothetical protein